MTGVFLQPKFSLLLGPTIVPLGTIISMIGWLKMLRLLLGRLSSETLLDPNYP